MQITSKPRKHLDNWEITNRPYIESKEKQCNGRKLDKVIH